MGKDPSDREKDVRTSFRLRMERFQKDGQFYAGEIVRVQRDNIPPEAKPTGLVPLTIGGLGHAIAFRYHPALQVMAVQYDDRAVSTKLFAAYLQAVDATQDYRFDPLVRADAWERYNNGSPRKLEIAIASPSSLEAVEGKVGALTDAGRKLGEIADAPMIRVEISMGSKRNGFLDTEFVSGVLRHFTRGVGKYDDVRTLRATVRDDDGSDIIDFFDEKLSEKEVIELPSRDADAHYKARARFLKRCFDDHLAYISDTYGPQK